MVTIMIDREKVQKGLECCGGTGMCFHGCPYHEVSPNVEGCTSQLASDALELLKKQEAEQPIVHENSYGWKFYYCPKCKQEFYQNRKQAYCDKCGQAVRWK